MRDQLTVAVVQPRPRTGPDAAGNVAAAVAAIDNAASQGAQLVLFPEGYPGPMRITDSYDAMVELSAAAARAGTAVCWGRTEAEADGRYRRVAYVHGSDGAQQLRYVRSHPATGDVSPKLSGAAMAPGPAVAPLFEVCGIRCGLLICSELWLPEIARVLAVRGAEVLLAPAGGGFGAVAENWRLIAACRAVENEAYVALTQGLFGNERGSALIAGPEGVLTDPAEPEGVLVAILDLERARWLRAQDDSMAEPKPFRSLPGLLRARRPQLYAELAEETGDLYDYEGAAAPVGAEGDGRTHRD